MTFKDLLYVLVIFSLTQLTSACTEESEPFVVDDDDDIEDNGIYHPDSLNMGDTTATDTSSTDTTTMQPEQVGYMANVSRDLEIVMIDECDDTLFDNPSCWDNHISSYVACDLKQTFNRGKTGWSGGDATYSLDLPDGRVLWIFADSFLGEVNEAGQRISNKLVNNTFVLTQGNEFETIFGGTLSNPSAILIPNDANDWYWPSDATVHDDELQMTLAHMRRTGSGGMWGFAYKQFDLAIFSLPDLELKSLTNKVPSAEISYGSCIMEDDNHTYIYGISRDAFGIKRAHAARVAGGNLSDDWEFYNGTDWVDEPSDFGIQANVSDQFSIFKEDNKYYFLTQEGIFGATIYLYESDSPVGPWNNRQLVYCTPETGGDIFTYNAFVHPELSENGELVISYNINSFQFSDLFSNADNYRPKFVKVEGWK